MGWRSKFIFLLMVYASGFATAIYCLAPAPDPVPDPGSGKLQPIARIRSVLKSEDLARSFNSGMHKCLDFGKDAAAQAVAEAAKMLQAKMEEAAKTQVQGQLSGQVNLNANEDLRRATAALLRSGEHPPRTN